MKNIKGKTVKGKGKRKMGWIIAVAIVAVLGIGAGVGMSYVNKEHREVRNLPLNLADFSKLKDGVYTGKYDGMYNWRTNTVEVTVSGGKVTGIKLLSAGFKYDNMTKPDTLYNQIIEKQTLQVDVISGATLTSKGYLQAVENALIKAEK